MPTVINPLTLNHISEDLNPEQHRCGNLKLHTN